MLKTLRAGALAFAALCLAPFAAHAACPTAPTYTTLSGLDAASATKSMQMYNGGGGFLATPLLHGWNGTAMVALTADANCNLDVDIVAGGPTGYTLEAGHIATVDTNLALLAAPYAAPLVCNATASMTATTQTSLCAAPGSSKNNYITQIICGNSSATVGTFVDVEDGSAGTVLAVIPAGISYQGGTISFGPQGLKQPTTNTALFLVNETTGAAVKCSAVGYTK